MEGRLISHLQHWVIQIRQRLWAGVHDKILTNLTRETHLEESSFNREIE